MPLRLGLRSRLWHSGCPHLSQTWTVPMAAVLSPRNALSLSQFLCPLPPLVLIHPLCWASLLPSSHKHTFWYILLTLWSLHKGLVQAWRWGKDRIVLLIAHLYSILLANQNYNNNLCFLISPMGKTRDMMGCGNSDKYNCYSSILDLVFCSDQKKSWSFGGVCGSENNSIIMDRSLPGQVRA